VHKDLGFTLDDFRALNRREVLKDLGLMAATALAIVGLHVSLPAWTEWLWGPVLFMQCVLVFRRQTFLHARMHYVANMTGWPVLDWAVDGLLMLLLGMSKDAFYRRHIDEHLSHISNMARVFGEDWKVQQKRTNQSVPFLNGKWACSRLTTCPLCGGSSPGSWSSSSSTRSGWPKSAFRIASSRGSAWSCTASSAWSRGSWLSTDRTCCWCTMSRRPPSPWAHP